MILIQPASKFVLVLLCLLNLARNVHSRPITMWGRGYSAVAQPQGLLSNRVVIAPSKSKGPGYYSQASPSLSSSQRSRYRNGNPKYYDVAACDWDPYECYYYP
ncbi:hypothetical protein PCANC_19009 [Puccinia coronata f. sp. avenae]|uniref:Uncharacterized protein n=1 Tax=Puccinia coronata f. sp. avenae TaxID=200324 RepID=A0A2N5TR48_9BASI|nr:hypothetical protein PCASD_14701 [Puccinia coronata f. sp. avenae]PLW27941.1 hypothetical protein PCANC_25988 [Puccinia coronata f. sp. avenae]PLW36400.1 hypothetical protein PCASD_13713 [Puccinia coronata f. sp. avenae]PLW37094.1 hypothetical protein PCANC_19009 [Puccinia coronata f. sp. avenae]